jgi:membrane protein DedA with SNARE-associated domain
VFHEIVAWLTQTIGHWGYPGIVALMFLESSFFPFPSEVVIPPAGYLVAAGKMSMGMVLLAGTLGSLLGALFNYWLAMKLGRPFLERYGRYLLISARSLEKADRFFQRHGHISMFIGRLLPGIRQYISLPAGIARMNLLLFCAATALGAGIWVAVLAVAGFWFGQNEELITRHLHWITLGLVLFCLSLGLAYWLRWRRRDPGGGRI